MIFMELDDAGNIVHVMNDPSCTRLPVVNRFVHRDGEGKQLVGANGHPASPHGHRVLGIDPKEHPPHLLPREISKEHFDALMATGLSGRDDNGFWHYRWDEVSLSPVRIHSASEGSKSTLPERKFPQDMAPPKPCKDCPDKVK
jgi:hypothetical protein